MAREYLNYFLYGLVFGQNAEHIAAIIIGMSFLLTLLLDHKAFDPFSIISLKGRWVVALSFFFQYYCHFYFVSHYDQRTNINYFSTLGFQNGIIILNSE